jgi:hypothetical protein
MVPQQTVEGRCWEADSTELDRWYGILLGAIREVDTCDEGLPGVFACLGT